MSFINHYQNPGILFIIIGFVLLSFSLTAFAQNDSLDVLPDLVDSIQENFQDSSEGNFSLKPNETDEITNFGFDDMVRGKFSGVLSIQGDGRPGSVDEFLIRGISDFVYHTQALVVLDGLPLIFDELDDFNNPWNFINPADIESVDVIKTAEAVARYGLRGSPGAIIINSKNGRLNQPLKVQYKNSFSISKLKRKYQVYEADDFRNLIANRYNNNADTLAALGAANTNWQDEIYQDAFGHNQHVSVSGGLKNLPYIASVGYYDQEGVLKSDRLERLTYQIGVNPEFFNGRLKVHLNYSGSKIDQQIANRDAILNALAFDPTQPIYDANSNFGGYTTYVAGEGSMFPPGTPEQFAPYNPVALIDLTDNAVESKKQTFRYGLEYLISRNGNWSLEFNGASSKSKYERSLLIPSSASWKYYTDFNNGQKQYLLDDQTNNLLTAKLKGSQYLKKLRTKLTASLFASAQSYEIQQIDNNRRLTGQIYNDMDMGLDYSNRNYGFSFDIAVLGKYKVDILVSRIDNQRYYSKSGYNGNLFLTIAWDLHKEKFLSSVKWINELNPYFSYFTQEKKTEEEISWYGLPNIKEVNYGLNFSLLNRKINGGITMYSRLTRNFVMMVPNLGIPFYQTNAGNVANNGFEMDLSFNLIQSNNIRWKLFGNFNFNKNEVTSLEYDYLRLQDNYHFNFYIDGTGPRVVTEGKPAGTFSLYRQVYDPNGDPIEGLYEGMNGQPFVFPDYSDGKESIPSFYAGIGSTISFKNWAFSLFGRYVSGHSTYSFTESSGSYLNGVTFLNNEQLIFYNRLNNKDTYTFENSQLYSDYYAQPAWFFRLENIQLSYQFKNLVNDKLKLKVYTSASNLILIKTYRGPDPEVQGAIDYAAYQRPVIFNAGVIATFQ